MLFHIVLILGIVFESDAQNFVWNKVYGGSDNDFLRNICNSGSKNYIYTAGYFKNIKNPNILSKINLGNKFLQSKTLFQAQFIAKMDTSGQVIWAKLIFPYNYANIDGKRSIISDANDNVYILGNFDSDSTRILPNSPKINNTNLKPKRNFGRTSFIIKLDSSGNFLWQKVFTEGVPGWLMVDRNVIYSIIQPYYYSKLFFYDKDTLRNKNLILLTMNDSGKQMSFKGLLSIKNQNNFNTINPLIDSNELIIFSDIIGDTIYYNNISVAYPILTKQRSSMVKLRFSLSNGNLNESYTYTNNSGSAQISGAVKIGSNKYAISGTIYDSLYLKSYKKIMTQSNSYAGFCAILNNNKIVNVLHSEPVTPNQLYGSQFYDVSFHNNFVYLNGSAFRNVNFDGFKTYQKDGYFIFLKGDTMGNVMWVLRTGDSSIPYNTSAFAFDKVNAVYFGNTFENKFLVDNKTYFSKDSSVDFIISKIYDFSITRGNVSKGPYCAGDVFIVPYKKDGNYNTSNFFIAEISDEEGNFTGGQRELGRLKTNKDSSIIGKLPLLNVPTSPKYRIRILSTKPQVQSYYRYDSLRFLIYSKDTANAGRDTTVCYGAQLPVKTSGGSQWRWSPGNMVMDSTARKTITKPVVKPTRFRIIISDSSGCGKIDTAYKWVYPMQPIKIQYRDTTYCRGTAKVKYNVTGGLPLAYQYQWLTGNKKPLVTTPFLMISDTTPVNLLMVVADGCSSNDSLYFTIKRYDSLRLIMTKDTNICSELPAKIVAKAKGGKGSYYYTWRNNLNQVISNKDTLVLNNRNNKMFSVSVSDNCTNPSDSQAVKINLYEPLTFKVPNDTQLCYNNQFNIKPVILTGTKSGSYRFVFDNGFVKDSVLGEQTVKAFNYLSAITVKAKNLCDEIVSNSFNVNVLQKLKLNGASDVELCKGNLLNLNINASGGLNPKVKWLENVSNLISVSDNIDTGFNVKSSTKFTFIGFDNCSVPNDTVRMNLTVLPELKVSIQSPPYCFKDVVNLKAKITGGKVSNYQINWNDANGSVGMDSILNYNTGNKIQTLYFSLKDNCSEPFFDTIILSPMSLAKIGINDSVQCFKDNFFDLSNQFNNVKGSFAKTEWYYDTTFISSTIDSIYLSGTFTNSGKHRIKLIVRSKTSCLDSSEVMTEVYPVPSIQITWKRTASNYIYSTWRYEANAAQLIKKYTWFINSFAAQIGNPIFQEIDTSGDVRVKMTAEDYNGCYYDTIINYKMFNRLEFYIPNMITINGDGINDNFTIQGKEFIKTYHLEIFNRWGEKVFQSDNADEPWVPSDYSNNIYNYFLSILDVYDEKHLITGAFGVIR